MLKNNNSNSHEYNNDLNNNFNNLSISESNNTGSDHDTFDSIVSKYNYLQNQQFAIFVRIIPKNII